MKIASENNQESIEINEEETTPKDNLDFLEGDAFKKLLWRVFSGGVIIGAAAAICYLYTR